MLPDWHPAARSPEFGWTTGKYVGWTYGDFVEMFGMQARVVRLYQDYRALRMRMIVLGGGA